MTIGKFVQKSYNIHYKYICKEENYCSIYY